MVRGPTNRRMVDEEDYEGSGDNVDSGRNDDHVQDAKKNILSNVQSMFGELDEFLIQGSPDNMTSLGIVKSVIQTDCHINRSFLVHTSLSTVPFWDLKNYHIIRGALL